MGHHKAEAASRSLLSVGKRATLIRFTSRWAEIREDDMTHANPKVFASAIIAAVAMQLFAPRLTDAAEITAKSTGEMDIQHKTVKPGSTGQILVGSESGAMPPAQSARHTTNETVTVNGIALRTNQMNVDPVPAGAIPIMAAD